MHVCLCVGMGVCVGSYFVTADLTVSCNQIWVSNSDLRDTNLL